MGAISLERGNAHPAPHEFIIPRPSIVPQTESNEGSLGSVSDSAISAEKPEGHGVEDKQIAKAAEVVVFSQEAHGIVPAESEGKKKRNSPSPVMQVLWPYITAKASVKEILANTPYNRKQVENAIRRARSMDSTLIPTPEETSRAKSEGQKGNKNGPKKGSERKVMDIPKTPEVKNEKPSESSEKKRNDAMKPIEQASSVERFVSETQQEKNEMVEMIYSTYGSYIDTGVRQRTDTPADAEDVMQNVMERLLRTDLTRFPTDPHKQRAYLYSMISNTAHMYYRVRGTRRIVKGKTFEAWKETAREPETVEEIVVRREELAIYAVQSPISYMQGMGYSTADIAAMRGKSEAAIKSALHRERKEFREKIKENKES